MSSSMHTIGEFARMTGLTERGLRIYDDKGVLTPHRVDPDTGYRWYSDEQVDDGRLVAMLRVIDMPLREIRAVLEATPENRSAAVGRYWYRVERELDDRRRAVSALRAHTDEEEQGMSKADDALERGKIDGAFAVIAALAEIDDPGEAAEAYKEAMRTAYWESKDLTLTTAIAYAGTSRLLALAQHLEGDDAYEARSAVKAMTYNLASFSWPGWDEPDIEISPTDAAAGLAAARSNLAWAIELEKPQLALSRAHWMLGAHLLTGRDTVGAIEAFEMAEAAANRAAAEPEVRLARAFGTLSALAGGADVEGRLDSELEALGEVEHGPGFVDQVTAARRVLGI